MVYILDVFLREKDLHTTIMKIERYFILLILVIPVLILRDFTPNNELKYLSIVDEALRDGHFFTFYHQGELYADKPPLYFWLLMLSKWIWGEYNMFGLSLFSIIPALISVYVMNKWVEEETTTSLRWNGSLMLFTSAFFIGSGLVLRMDMLMCMFILLALYTFYKRYSGKGKPRDRVLLPFYTFMAIFSKGPIGFIVPLITMLVFLLVKRDVRSFCRYFGWREWGILSGFCAIWFLGIYLEGGSTYLNNLLFHQTINLAIDSFDHKKAFWYYGVTFWYSVAPWSILYITTIVIAIKKKLLTTDKEKLFLSAIASTFVILSMFSGKLDIYMLPLFPFFTYLTILLLPKIKEKWIAFSVYIPVTALTMRTPSGEESYHLVGNNITDLYNTAAAVALLREFGMSAQTLAASFETMQIVKTRFDEETVGGKTIIDNLAKGQNPIACSRVFDFVRKTPGQKAVILVIDDVHDAKNSTENTSWIYECDFEFLNEDSVRQIVVGGKRAWDFQMRLLMAGVPRERIVCCEQETDTARQVRLDEVDTIFLLHDICNNAMAQGIKQELRELCAKGGAAE